MDEIIQQLQALDCSFTITWERASKLWRVQIPWLDIASHDRDLREALRLALQMVEDNPMQDAD